MVVKVRRVCVPDVALESRVPARTRHHAETVARHLRVLTVTTRIGAVISLFFGIQGLIVGQDIVWIAAVNLLSGALFLMIPLLYRFGEMVPPWCSSLVAYTSDHCRVLAPRHGFGPAVLLPRRGELMVLILGVDHLVLASVLAAILRRDSHRARGDRSL